MGKRNCRGAIPGHVPVRGKLFIALSASKNGEPQHSSRCQTLAYPRFIFLQSWHANLINISMISLLWLGPFHCTNFKVMKNINLIVWLNLKQTTNPSRYPSPNITSLNSYHSTVGSPINDSTNSKHVHISVISWLTLPLQVQFKTNKK